MYQEYVCVNRRNLRLKSSSYVSNVVFVIIHTANSLVTEDVLFLTNCGCEGWVLTHRSCGTKVC